MLVKHRLISIILTNSLIKQLVVQSRILFKKYNIKNSKYWTGVSMYVYFAIPAINVVTLFISCFDYDNMVKDIQKTTVNEFMAWVENNK